MNKQTEINSLFTKLSGRALRIALALVIAAALLPWSGLSARAENTQY